MFSRHDDTITPIISSRLQNHQETSRPMNYAAAAATMNLKYSLSSSQTTASANYGETPTWRQSLTNNNNIQQKNQEQQQHSQTNSRSFLNQNNNNSYRPSRKYAVVLENTQNVNQELCLRAVADIIGGKNIHYCTRLSGGRTCLYLTNEDYVNKLCELEGIVTKGGEFHPCRRYITEATKFVISNCPPELDDEELKTLLQDYGRIVSTPARLRVSTSDDDLKHIKTWRRSVYIMIPDEAPEMPKRMLITAKETGSKFTLYIEKDEIVCSFCTRPGHVSEKCKKKQEFQQSFPELNSFTKTTSVSSRLSKKTNDEGAKSALIETPTTMFTPSFMNSERESTTSQVTKILTSETNTTISPAVVPAPTPSSIWGDLEDPSTANSNPKQSQTTKQTSFFFNEDMDTATQHSNHYDSDGSENLEDEFLTSNDLLEKMANKTKEKRQLSISPDSQPNLQQKKMKTITHTEDEEEYSQDHNKSSHDESNSEINSEAESVHPSENDEFANPKISKKKRKEQAAIDTLLEDIFFSNELTERNFRDFLKDCKGKVNSKKLAQNITTQTSILISKLDECILKCKNQNLQRRLQRARTALTEDESK